MTAYAGIGARSTPEQILLMMRAAASLLAEGGWTLRTGGAEGADRTFFDGAHASHGAIELFLPWPTFWLPLSYVNVTLHQRPTAAAYEIAKRYHPNWSNLRRGPRSLHARNAHVVLGAELNDPVRFILCWTPEGNGQGGTGQALRMAPNYGIPVIDLAKPESHGRLRAFLTSHAAQDGAHTPRENNSDRDGVRLDRPRHAPLRAP